MTWHRRVAVDGLVTVETNRYWVPAQYIGQDVDVLPVCCLGETTRCGSTGTASSSLSIPSTGAGTAWWETRPMLMAWQLSGLHSAAP